MPPKYLAVFSNREESRRHSFSGLESDECANDPENLAIYDVNTIANYDPEIIPFLDAPPGSARVQWGDGGVRGGGVHPSGGLTPVGVQALARITDCGRFDAYAEIGFTG